MTANLQAPQEAIFAGTGEMTALMRSFEWERTPVGSPRYWPQSLKTAVNIMLTSRFAMWMAWGPELTFFYNDTYRQETLGVKHPWALGSRAEEVWAEIWSDIGPRIEKVLQTGEATWDEALLLFLERSGYTEETYHTFSYSPLSNDDGKISGLLCVVTEETRRVIGERRLALLGEVASALASAQTSAEVFSAVARSIEANPRDLPLTLIYLFDGEGTQAHLVCSTGVPEGHPLAAQIVGKQDQDSCWPLEQLLNDHVPICMHNRTDLFQGLPGSPWGKPPQETMLVPLTQQGQERPAGFLVAGINPYCLLDEDYQGFVNLLTGQIAASLANVRAYEEEKRRAEALAELDRAKTTFFSNVSHEFRTPLTLMLGPMEDALSENIALQGNNLEIVHRNSLRLLKLVNTLLDFSRIEAGRVQASYEPTDLHILTEDLASVFRSAVERARLHLIVDCPPLSEPVFVDRDMWEKIVLNLLSNALKFTFDGEIEVQLREQEGKAVLFVRDSGTGIAPEELPHIFERFHRVEGTPSRTHEGTGIGLALVQELVRLHGGTVGVESTPGVGTCFRVSIPVGKAHLPAERISATSSLTSTALRADTFVEEALRWLPDGDTENSGGSYGPSLPVSIEARQNGVHRARILLADDNADVRDYVQRLLRPHYDVVAVPDGQQALLEAQVNRPDLVLSDVMMPRLDGFGLLQSLRGNAYTAGIPVILLSARAGEEARIEGISAGADDYLTKPFSARELLARVAGHIELARVRREAEQTIRESEERFRVALRNVPLTVFNCDRERRYTWIANPPDGLPAEMFIGKQDEDIYPEAERSEFIEFKENALSTGQGVRQEIAHVTPTKTRYYDMTAEPLKDHDGTLIGLTVAAFDITEIKQYEIDLATANARLQRAMTETHHRVKNNLQLISAMIDIQRIDGEETVPVEELTRLGANVRALGVIHDILTQEAKEGNDQETLSSRTVLKRLVALLEQTTGDRPLKMDFADIRISGKQATALALVTNELVSNAMKYGRGTIEIYLREYGDEVSLEVCDDGAGFPVNFDPKSAANTGLDLVENIVSWDLRGKVAYTNTEGGGARIQVTFLPACSKKSAL